MSSNRASSDQSAVVAGVVALLGAVIAVVWANLNLSGYHHVQHLGVGPLTLESWAADGGLTLFFFLAGLELKHELIEGTLRDRRTAAIPVVAACCGVAVPALVFVVMSLGTPNLRGWAISSPTDIAFALAVLAVLGSRAPSSLRVFLLTLAVVDDIVVIAIIAVAYSGSLHGWWLLGAATAIVAYGLLARTQPPLLLVPITLAAWWCTLHSGVHATIAGVALGLLSPLSDRLQRVLSPWSSFVAVPFFALLSAGVPLSGSVGEGRVFWAALIGLVIGKPVGITVGALGASRLVKQPWDGASGSLRDLVGLGFLGGIGFTVALLVTDLSFGDAREQQAKVGVLLASCIAATIGALILTAGRAHRGATR